MLDRTKDPLDEAGRPFVTRLGAFAAVGLATALLVTGCSSSSKPKSSTTPPAPTTSATSSSAGGSLTGDAATIRDVYLRFLDLKIPVARKVDLIQDGPEFLTAMQNEAKNPQAATVSLQVSNVQVTSATLATVTYTILVSGSPLLPNQKGYAVKEDGKWKVAGITFCGLLAAQSPTAVPPACSKPAATALPTG